MNNIINYNSNNILSIWFKIILFIYYYVIYYENKIYLK